MYSEPFCNIFNRIIYICLIFRRNANCFIVCPKVYVSIYTLYTHDVYRPDYINPLTLGKPQVFREGAYPQEFG